MKMQLALSEKKLTLSEKRFNGVILPGSLDGRVVITE